MIIDCVFCKNGYAMMQIRFVYPYKKLPDCSSTIKRDCSRGDNESLM